MGAMAGALPSGAGEQVHQLLLWRQTGNARSSEADAETCGSSGGTETKAAKAAKAVLLVSLAFHCLHAGLNGFWSRQHAELGSQGTPGCVLLVFSRFFGLFGLEVRQLNAASSTWAPSTNSFFRFFAFPIFLGSLPVLGLLLIGSQVPFL